MCVYNVFHGTDQVFNLFDEEFQRDSLGYFFSECPDDAKCYGDIIKRCIVTLNNPYKIKFSDIYIDSEPTENSPWSLGQDVLKAWGHDGVIIYGGQEQYDATGEYESLYTQYIVFSSNAIKEI